MYPLSRWMLGFGAALRWVGACLGLALMVVGLLACSEEDSEHRAQLYVAVQSDLVAPQDIDTLVVEAQVDGKPKYVRALKLLPEGEDGLPFVAPVLADEAVGAEVVVTVVALRDGEARAFAKAVTTFPETGAPVLRLPIQWLCLDNVKELGDGSYASACKKEDGHERVCRAGQCVTPDIALDDLPQFSPAGFPGADSHAGEGVCFDVGACFEGSVVATPDAECRVELAASAEHTNFAIVLDAASQTGMCDDDECLVPLDRDEEFGWTFAEPDAGASGVQLPVALCGRIEEGEASGVRVSSLCDNKGLANPSCGPWTTFTAFLRPGLGAVIRDAGDAAEPLSDSAASDAGAAPDAAASSFGHDSGVRILLPENTTRIVPGDAIQLTLFGIAARDVEWSTSDAAVATVDEDGVLTAHGVGTVEVRAWFNGQDIVFIVEIEAAEGGDPGPGLGVVLIRQDLVKVRVEPSHNTTPVGVSVPLRAFATFEDGSAEEVTEAVTWTTDDEARVSVDNRGVATARAVGTASITADYGTLGAATAVFEVTAAELIGLRLAPDTVSVPVGVSVQLLAEATFSDGTERDVTRDVVWSVDGALVAVDSDGVFEGRAPGVARVAAAFGGNRATLDVTVTDAQLLSLSVEPADVELAVGMSRALVALASFSDGTTLDVTQTALFGTADAQVVAVGAAGHIVGVAAGQSEVLVSYGGSALAVPVVVSDATLVGLRVEPAALSVGAGLSKVAYAVGTYSDGSSANVSGDVSWRSEDVAVASVEAGGAIRGVGPGVTTIVAALGTLRAEAAVTVTDSPLIALQVEPDEFTLPAGNQRQLRASGVFADGSSEDLTAQVAWQSTAVDVLSVASGGRVTGIAAGEAEVSAVLLGVVGYAQGTVNEATVVAVRIEPGEVALPKGTTRGLTAWVTYSDGLTLDMTDEVAWTSTAPALGSVNGAGTLRGLAPGAFEVRASVGGYSASTAVVVSDAVVTGLSLTPEQLTLPVGQDGPLTLMASYSDGGTRQITENIAWSSANGTIASVAGGVVRAEATGATVVRAKLGALEASALVTVTDAVLTGLSLLPASAQIPLGVTVPFAATGDYSDGSTRDVSGQVAWATGAPAVAVVSSGSVTGVKAGSATITARLGGFDASGVVTITDAVVTGLTVTPESITLPLGRTQSLVASADYTDGSTRDVTAETLFRLQTGSAVALEGATVRGIAAGAATVVAELDGYSDVATVQVTPALVEALHLTPAIISVPAGNTLQLSLTADYSDGVTRPVLTGATWSSNAPSVASVTGGQLAAHVPGAAQVKAAFGGKEVSAEVSVTSAVLTGLVLSSEAVTAPAGRTRAVTAEGTYSDGINRAVVVELWTSDNTTVATVSSGVITAKAIGSTVVRAEFQGQTAQVAVTVTSPLLEGLVVEAPSAVVPVGLTIALVAKATYSDGHTEAVDAGWTSSQTARATVNAGVVTGVGAGSVTISAAFGGQSASVGITVSAAVLDSIKIVPAEASVPAGGRVGLVLAATYSDGQTVAVTQNVQWSSNAVAIATVSAKGEVQGEAPGDTTVLAKYQGLQAAAPIHVSDAVIESIRVSPSTHSMPAGRAVTLVVSAHYSDGREVPVTGGVEWSSSNTTALTVSAGVATGHVPTSGVTVEAALGVHSATATIVVTDAELVAVALVSPSESVPNGKTVLLALSATYSDGRTREVPNAEVDWRSLTPQLASVSAGVVRATAVGTARVQATFDGQTAVLDLRVTAAELVGLSLEPSSVSVARGLTASLGAVALYSDGGRQAATGVTWRVSGALGIARVSGGVVTGDAVGETVVTAELGGFSDSAEVEVRAAELVEVRVTPAAVALPLGQKVTLQAFGAYSDGTSELLPSPDWRNEGGRVRVSAAGVVEGIATGEGKVVAAFGGKEGHATVNVTAAVAQSLVIQTPTEPVAVGLTAPLAIVVTFSDGSTQRPKIGVDWLSLTPEIFSVNASGVVTALAASRAGQVRATFGGVTAVATLVTTAAVVTSLSIDPLAAAIPAGLSAKLTARATYSDDRVVVVSPTEWRVVVNPGNATVDASGTVFGAAAGAARVRATFQGATAEQDVTISDAVLQSIAVAPASSSIFEGGEVALRVSAVYSDSETAVPLPNGVVVSWTSSDSQVADVNAGKVMGNAPGKVTITATVSGAAAAQATVEVLAVEPVELAVTPATVTMDYGATVTPAATVLWSDGSRSSTVKWSFSSAVLTEVSSGRFQATGHGAGSIRAEVGSLTVTVPVTVNPVVTGLAVSPAAAEVAVGGVASFTARAVYSDETTKALPATAVDWFASPTDLVTELEAGQYRGDKPGEVQVNVVQGSLQSPSAILKIAGPVLTSLALVFDTSTALRPGEVTTLELDATFSDDSTRRVTSSATWTAAGAALKSLTVNSYQAVTEGSTTITAAYGGLTTSQLFGVKNDSEALFAVLPETVTLREGQSTTLTATITYAQGAALDVSALAEWSAKDPDIASVEGNSVAYKARGSTSLLAEFGGHSASARYRGLEYRALRISPADGSVSVGGELALKVEALLVPDGTEDVTKACAFRSADENVATVEKSGVVTGRKEGSVEIYAQLDGLDAVAKVSVVAQRAVCGNETVEPPEECDDGNTKPGDGCDAKCVKEGEQD